LDKVNVTLKAAAWHHDMHYHHRTNLLPSIAQVTLLDHYVFMKLLLLGAFMTAPEVFEYLICLWFALLSLI
jgi:hypothetical protein